MRLRQAQQLHGGGNTHLKGKMLLKRKWVFLLSWSPVVIFQHFQFLPWKLFVAEHVWLGGIIGAFMCLDWKHHWLPECLWLSMYYNSWTLFLHLLKSYGSRPQAFIVSMIYNLACSFLAVGPKWFLCSFPRWFANLAVSWLNVMTRVVFTPLLYIILLKLPLALMIEGGVQWFCSSGMNEMKNNGCLIA